MARDKLHVLLMGRPGAGKSTLAAGFEKPMLVALCDPPGKEQPYLDRGIPGEIKADQFGYYREVFSKKEPERLIIRIEYWGEANPLAPNAYPRWISRFANIEQEIVDKGWKTLVLDTATFFDLSARYYSINFLNKEAKPSDWGVHYRFATNASEQYIMMRWPNLLLANTLVLAHIDDQKDEADSAEGGVVIRKMAALPGKLPNRLPGGFGEVWRVYVDQETGQRIVQTQQRVNNSFDCKSLKGFPDGQYAHIDALWKALEEKNAKAEAPV